MAVVPGSAGGSQYDGEQGVKIAPPASTVKADYRKSDYELLEVDPSAPDLGDLGPLDSQGKPIHAPAPKEPAITPETVEIDDENRPVTKKAPEAEKPKAPEKAEDDEDDEKPDETDQKKTAESKEPEKEPEPLAPVKVSEELKAHFADPKVGRELKNAFYGFQAYKEIFPKVEDARDLAAMFPNVEEARQVMEAYEGFSELQDAYEKNPTEFVEKLHEEGEAEFGAIAEALMDRLPELDRTTYSRIGRQIVRDSLGYIYEQAEKIARKNSLDPENLRNAADVIAMNLFDGKSVSQLDTAPDEKDSRIAELERELHQERESKVESSLKRFSVAVDQHIDKELNTTITQMVDELLNADGAKEAVSTKARKEMETRIHTEVLRTLGSNRRLLDEMRDLAEAQDGDFGSRHLKATAKPALRLANLEIRRAAARIVPEWTREILQVNEEKLSKQRQAASRRDFASGGGPRLGEPLTQVRPEDIDYSRTSSEDILEGRITMKRR
ncbi:MAG: hypothetical protein L0338_39665 [Acidobacteria bacterium]|nr:hypothetical protein [Acidobacteriota bacterium]